MATGKDTSNSSVTEEKPLSDTQLSQILQALKKCGDYVVLTKDEYEALKHPTPTSTPILKDPVIKPKLTLSDKINASRSFQGSLYETSAMQIPKVEVKLPFFSGDQPPLKGDVTYDVWRYETKCLISDDTLSQSVALQIIRRSLRGTARQILIPLGEKASMTDILQKLDTLFGNVSTNESIMQTFYSESQKTTENVTTYGCRLESLLQVAVESGHVSQAARNDMLRSKFWTGLRDEKLKLLTRHKYDTILNYDRLLREVRAAEQEMSTTEKLTTAQHQPVSAGKDKAVEDLSNKMDTLMAKMHSLEKQMRETSKQEAPNSNNYTQTCSGFNNRSRGNFRGRGRSHGRYPNQSHRENGRNNYSYQSHFDRSGKSKTEHPKV